MADISTPLLEQVLADFRGEAAVLRRNGHSEQAESMERVCDAVGECTEGYRRFLGEADALLYSGKSRKTLRRLFPELAALGNAYQNGRGQRFYRQMCLPRRLAEETLRDSARQAALEDSVA